MRQSLCFLIDRSFHQYRSFIIPADKTAITNIEQDTNHYDADCCCSRAADRSQPTDSLKVAGVIPNVNICEVALEKSTFSFYGK